MVSRCRLFSREEASYHGRKALIDMCGIVFSEFGVLERLPTFRKI